ncbi:MerR family transcriptional regulator [Fusibacter sp. 3D3]|uniref:MerR family transcriptional regulator n=1 Tax=Fusibacter sp. 3D3 TaxID=1048380 RepID=UPI0008531F48|nr:MerR family transcriptional regulator [Fusibacter sp. 3D3]GAU79977.1 hypothetical protein F3D3_4642 [Fusibacter sp. 3D3]
MTLKDIELQTGMDQANIRFYESEGLITPKKLDNGDRYYLEEELQILLRIKLLRSLHISLDEIKALRYGNKGLMETLSTQIEILKSETQAVMPAIEVCRTLQEDQMTFDELDGQKYLELMQQIRGYPESGYVKADEDELSQVFHPWRRYFARITDIFVYSSIWMAVLIFVLHVSMIRRGSLWDIFDTFVAVGIMIFVEPLLLNRFGTTFGKAIFGLRIETSEGQKLSYKAGFDRTWHVIGAGLGYNIPIYSLVRLWKSYKLCQEKEAQPWDRYIAYTIKDTKWYRGMGYIGVNVALFVLLVVMMMSQLLPPNRGDLTQLEFIENHNYYAHYFGMSFGNKVLNKDGEWVDKVAEEGTIYYDYGYLEMPQYVYLMDNGVVKGVSFEVMIDEPKQILSSYDAHLLLSSLAFACAQDEMTLFSKLQERIASQIDDHTFEDFHFTEAGIEFDCQIEYTGYEDRAAHFLFSNESATEHAFKLIYSMRQVD